MTPSRVERGSTANAIANFRAPTLSVRQTADRAVGGKDGKVVEKRGGNGTQTVRSFRAPKPPQQAESLCHRMVRRRSTVRVRQRAFEFLLLSLGFRFPSRRRWAGSDVHLASTNVHRSIVAALTISTAGGSSARARPLMRTWQPHKLARQVGPWYLRARVKPKIDPSVGSPGGLPEGCAPRFGR